MLGRRHLAVQAVEAFSEVVAAKSSNKLTVIDWTAAWCGPCQSIAPVLEDLSNNYPNTNFLKVDVDKFTQEAQDAGIAAMPTFQFFKSDVMVAEFKGADAQKLSDTIKNLQD